MKRLSHRLYREFPYASRPRPRANPSKARGTRWESELVAYLRDSGFPHARRNVQHGPNDIGDVGGVPKFAIEAKDTQKHDLAKFVKQANAEAENAGQPWGVAAIKKRRAATEDAYVVLDLKTFTEVAHAAAAWVLLNEKLEANREGK